MKDNQPSFLSHPAETLIAAYAIGRCSPTEQAEIDEHCFTCEKCRARLSILLRVSATDGSEEERRQLERLFPLGIETIAQARQDGNQFTIQSVAKDRQISPSAHLPQLDSQQLLGLLFGFIYPKRYLFALTFLAVLTVGIGGYFWYTRTYSPLRKSVEAVNRSYRNNRPLEARVTGGFNYQPYEPTRGGVDTLDVNRDQIDYALAELTRAVASNPTPETRHALGRIYLLLGKFDDAERQMKAALEGSPKNANLHADFAALYYECSKQGISPLSDGGKQLTPSTLLSLAVEHYKDAIEINPNLAEALFNLGLCYEQMELFDQAIEQWNQYLKIDSDSSWSKEAREHLKKLDSRAIESQEGPKKTQLAIEKAAELNDEAALRQLISQSFATVKEFSTGPLFDKYLEAALSGKEESAEAQLKTIKLIGRLTSEIKKDEYLNDLADFASRASPDVKSGMQNIRLMLRQADSELDRSPHDAAYKLYLSAYQAAERIGDQEHAETVALSLFRYYNLRAKSQELITLGNKIAAQSERHKHLQIQAKTENALANAYLASQQNDLALENSLRALEVAKSLGDNNTTMNSLRFASAAYSRVSDYERALNKDFELLSFLRNEPPGALVVAAYQQAGETFFRLDNYKMARLYQQEALQIASSIHNPLYLAGSAGRLGLTLWKLGENDEAMRHLNNAIAITTSLQEGLYRQLLQIELNTTLGDVALGQNKPDESITHYQSAIQAIKNNNNRVYLSSIHQGLATAYLAMGQIPKAETEFQTSISLAERDRRQIRDAGSQSTFLASRQSVYRTMVDLQFNTKNDRVAAFDYAEIGKSRSLLDTFSGKTVTGWQDGQVKLSIFGNAQPMKLKQIQHALPRDIQLLFFSVTEKKVMTWLITSDNTVTASVDYDASRLQNAVSDYLADLRARREIDLINRRSAELYQLLIAPVADKLDRDRLLCIIPDATLYLLPFAALYSPQNRYLVEDYSITFAPSASVLIKTMKLATAKSSRATESFFGIGNPRFNSLRFQGLPNLAAAAEEISRSRSLYQQSEYFSKEDATESEVVRRMGSHEIAHIASHILINERSPLLSSILLAEEKATKVQEKAPPGVVADGTLQAQEIYQMSFPKTKLMILSGCRSAAGTYANGEALGALAQSFFAAKVPAVIASLWEVDDASSAEIMYSFHYNHRVNHQSFGEALSQAQRSVIHSSNTRRQHPYYWAAFLLSGDGRLNATSLN